MSRFLILFLLTIPIPGKGQLSGRYVNPIIGLGHQEFTFSEGNQFAYYSSQCGYASRGNGHYDLQSGKIVFTFDDPAASPLQSSAFPGKSTTTSPILSIKAYDSEDSIPWNLSIVEIKNREGIIVNKVTNWEEETVIIHPPAGFDSLWVTARIMEKENTIMIAGNRDYDISIVIETGMLTKIEKGETRTYQIKKGINGFWLYHKNNVGKKCAEFFEHTP
jgi:hypothetical protein